MTIGREVLGGKCLNVLRFNIGVRSQSFGPRSLDCLTMACTHAHIKINSLSMRVLYPSAGMYMSSLCYSGFVPCVSGIFQIQIVNRNTSDWVLTFYVPRPHVTSHVLLLAIIRTGRQNQLVTAFT